MNFEQMGEVFAYLLAYREVCGEPFYRKRRQEEKRIAAILENATMSESLANFESFLNAQGFTLKVYDSTYFGKAFNKDNSRSASSCFVLARIDTSLAPFIDPDWFNKNSTDNRRSAETREERIVWGVQLWLLLQSLLYTRIGRSPSEVSRFDETTVTVAELAGAARELIEKMRTEGRPEKANGIVWDILVKKSKKTTVESRARKFFDIMETAGMLEHVKEAGDGTDSAYRQSILAATEMSINISRGFECLRPAGSLGDTVPSVVDVIQGYREEEG